MPENILACYFKNKRVLRFLKLIQQLRIMPPRAKARVATITAASKAAIRASHESGHAAQKFATSEAQYLDVGGSRLTLVAPDGRTTLFGAFYYKEVLEIPPPELYPYNAQLIDKWVVGFSGKKSSFDAEVQTVNGNPRKEENNSSYLSETSML